MRSKENWRPTKFATVDGKLRGDQTGVHLSVGSQFIGDLVAPRYAAALRDYARGQLLDLGCGNVPLYETYRDYVDEVTCVDWPASLHERRHIDVFANLALPLPFRDGCFDTVVLTDVLEHIPTPELLIAEIARILGPGGRTVIGVPFFYHLHEVPYDFNRYTRYQLERLLTNAGLGVALLEEVGGSPEVLIDVISKTLVYRPRLTMRFVAAAKWILKRKVIKRVSERTRSAFPLAYVVVAEKARTAQSGAERESITSLNVSALR